MVQVYVDTLPELRGPAADGQMLRPPGPEIVHAIDPVGAVVVPVTVAVKIKVSPVSVEELVLSTTTVGAKIFTITKGGEAISLSPTSPGPEAVYVAKTSPE